MAIYDDIDSLISSGQYELADLLHRIDVIYIGGSLTDDERGELIRKARDCANPESSMASLSYRIENLESWRKTVDAKLAELSGGSPGEPGEPSEEWPVYVQPTGAHDAYYTGDKITFNDKHYICVAPEDTPVVWDPDTYPDYWEVQI